jgi:hypothetical protein
MIDEIRERAREWLRDRLLDEPTLVDSLADALLSERAAALGAAVSEILAAQTSKRSARMSNASVLPVSFLIDRIRSLSPEGWRAVREADLAVVKEAAHEALAHFYAPLEELQQYRDRADEIRAALARMP